MGRTTVRASNRVMEVCKNKGISLSELVRAVEDIIDLADKLSTDKYGFFGRISEITKLFCAEAFIKSWNENASMPGSRLEPLKDKDRSVINLLVSEGRIKPSNFTELIRRSCLYAEKHGIERISISDLLELKTGNDQNRENVREEVISPRQVVLLKKKGINFKEEIERFRKSGGTVTSKGGLWIFRYSSGNGKCAAILKNLMEACHD